MSTKRRARTWHCAPLLVINQPPGDLGVVLPGSFASQEAVRKFTQKNIG